MRLSRIVIATACLVSTLGEGTGTADERGSGRCRDIDAEFTSQLSADACAAPFVFCATGAIKHDPLLRGPMVVAITDVAPSAGMPSSEPATMLSVSGTRTLTPVRGGTLTAHVIGVFDTAQVVFSELNVITGGTGRFAGATGTINVFGRAVSETTFAGTIRGEICLP